MLQRRSARPVHVCAGIRAFVGFWEPHPEGGLRGRGGAVVRAQRLALHGAGEADSPLVRQHRLHCQYAQSSASRPLLKGLMAASQRTSQAGHHSRHAAWLPITARPRNVIHFVTERADCQHPSL